MTPKPTNSYDSALAALHAQKALLENNLLDLRAACTTDAQRQALATSFHTAVMQYETALTRSLTVNDASVLRGIGQITNIQQQIQDDIDQANNIAGILNKIAASVQFGTSIVSLLAVG